MLSNVGPDKEGWKWFNSPVEQSMESFDRLSPKLRKALNYAQRDIAPETVERELINGWTESQMVVRINNFPNKVPTNEKVE